MSRPVIITCAVTGSGDTTAASPYVPITPEQIANEALKAHAAGAAIVHIHVRDPETGKPSRDIRLYRDVVGRIRQSGADVVINLTTGVGARFTPAEDDPNRNAVSGLASPEELARSLRTCSTRGYLQSLPCTSFAWASHGGLPRPRRQCCP